MMNRGRILLSLWGGLTLLLNGLLSAPARAEVTENIKIPFDGFSVFVPCANGGAGELVVFTGDLHEVLSSTVNGNNVRGKFHDQPQGLTGVGSITGDKYQATGVTQDTFKGSLQNGQFRETYINNFRMIGQGPGNNFLVHETFHFTINADGTQTAFHDSLNVECK